MPSKSGIAFVLVQHLAPDRSSILCDLIRRFTSMAVFQVDDGMPVQINTVYIIPPNSEMALLNGTLRLIEPLAPHGRRRPIDYFFRSLAQDQHERAIGIILSGTGTDGTPGVSAIKAEGGMAMAQSPESAEFDGMPRNALATGLMDYELPAAEMPARLIAYVAHAFRNLVRLPTMVTPGSKDDRAMKKIFVLLRTFTGHDFSQYKPGTVQRRIARRLALHGIETIENYASYLQQTPAEGSALFRELLIGVTSFFREPKTFDFLAEKGLPALFEGKSSGSTIRFWSVGCSTGEEPYSLAMLLQERMAALDMSFNLQIFASDIDIQAVTVARVGLYPASIAADITPERLARFFTLEPGGNSYRVKKDLRDLIIFSEHDLLKDPPFSKIDLVSCRNLLIYLDADLQKRIIPLFHYTMNPGGLLFLGSSENVVDFESLFLPMDRNMRLYRRNEIRHGTPQPIVDYSVPLPNSLRANHPKQAKMAHPLAKLSLRELTEKALMHAIQAAALVNEKGDILYIHGHTGRYLELAPGVSTISNILNIAREGLKNELSEAMHQVAKSQKTVFCRGVRIKTNASFITLNLTVAKLLPDPDLKHEAALYVILFDEVPNEPENQKQKVDARIVALTKKLQDRDAYLQSSIQELTSSTEELRSANEELQLGSEELQSANEELETAKEELQSSNEELHTVNNELQIKVVDLAQANNDINNLLVGTGIGTMFVDHQLRILRFTSPVAEIINLLPSDVGRPVSDLSTRLKKYHTLEEDIREVLRNLIPTERAVQTTEGKWFLLRILPYRTTANVIEGAVLSFLDITEHRRVELVSEQLAAIVRSSEDAIIGEDFDGMVTSWNPGAEKIFGYTAAEMVGTSITCLVPPDRQQEKTDMLATIKSGSSVKHWETQRLAKDRTLLDVSLTISPIRDSEGQVVGLSSMARDIKEKKRSQLVLDRLAVVVRDSSDAITVQDLEGRTLAWNPGAERLYGWSEDEALRMNVLDRIPPDQREGAMEVLTALSRAQMLEANRTRRLCKFGDPLEISIISSALLNPAGEMFAVATTEREIRAP